MLNIRNFCVNAFQENTLLLWDETGEGVVVDPGCVEEEEREGLLREISAKGLTLKAIWLTHGHFDHIYGAARLSRKFRIPVRMAPEDGEILRNAALFAAAMGMPAPDDGFATAGFREGERLAFGNAVFEVIATPGHTPGSVCFYERAEKILISGDTLFAGSIGRTDHPGGDYDKLIVSIMDKLMGLDGDVRVFPGHGPDTDIGYERTHNPFLQPFNERLMEFSDEE